MREFVLVHGGGHSAWCWHLVQQGLAERGIESTALDLSLQDIDTDAKVVRSHIDAACEDVVLVGHSRGGRVISIAAIGSINVSRLVFLAAGIDEPTRCLPNGPRPTLYRQISRETQSLSYAQARDCFYHDVPTELAFEAYSRLRPSPPNTRFSRCQQPMAWHDLPTTYVVCTADRCIHPDDQREMALQMDESFEIPTGHSAFLSRPDHVVELLARHA